MAVRFHWILEGKLAGMEMPGYYMPLIEDLLFLLKQGFDIIVSLTEAPHPGGSHLMRKFEWIHFPIKDFMAPDVVDAYELIKQIHTEIEQNHKKVLFHCFAGIGRTGTMLAAYLIYANGWSAPDALAWIRQIDPSYVQSVIQEEFLDEFEIYCNAMRESPSSKNA